MRKTDKNSHGKPTQQKFYKKSLEKAQKSPIEVDAKKNFVITRVLEKGKKKRDEYLK